MLCTALIVLVVVAVLVQLFAANVRAVTKLLNFLAKMAKAADDALKKGDRLERWTRKLQELGKRKL